MAAMRPHPGTPKRPVFNGTLFFKTVLSSGYILILLSIEYILASLIEMCQG